LVSTSLSFAAEKCLASRCPVMDVCGASLTAYFRRSGVMSQYICEYVISRAENFAIDKSCVFNEITSTVSLISIRLSSVWQLPNNNAKINVAIQWRRNLENTLHSSGSYCWTVASVVSWLVILFRERITWWMLYTAVETDKSKQVCTYWTNSSLKAWIRKWNIIIYKTTHTTYRQPTSIKWYNFLHYIFRPLTRDIIRGSHALSQNFTDLRLCLYERYFAKVYIFIINDRPVI
jgi:hypothetical protein